MYDADDHKVDATLYLLSGSEASPSPATLSVSVSLLSSPPPSLAFLSPSRAFPAHSVDVYPLRFGPLGPQSFTGRSQAAAVCWLLTCVWISEYSHLAWALVYIFFWLLIYNTYNTIHILQKKLNMLQIYNTECDRLHEHHSPEIILIKFGCMYLNYFPLHIYTDVVNKHVPSVISA